MDTAVEYRQVSAKYYDEAYSTKEDLDDFEFYVDIAKANGGPVLELACGTGRILLPIAREGISIHGVDNSVPMLNVLQDKLQHEVKDVRELELPHFNPLRGHKDFEKLSDELQNRMKREG